MQIRSPICTTLGHVDHGKSSILDSIRGSNIIAKEAGNITQAIGASIVPLSALKKRCGKLLDSLNINLTIPGILFIDTPGHAAFTSLRKRGGNLADIAILVVDINEGFKPQTIEAIEILKSSKTPFVIAANKIDLIPGFREDKKPLLQLIASQAAEVQTHLDMKYYELVGKLSEQFQINSERFDRVDDFTKQISIVPISAKKGIGISELLMVLVGITQRFLETCLHCTIEGPAKGTILEVKEEKGLGKTADIIIYDGSLKVNDMVVLGTLNDPVVTKVKALLVPAPLAEMRDKGAKFKSVKQVSAAMGVKLAAPDLGSVIAGMPLRGTTLENLENIKEEISMEVHEVLIDTDDDGVILKADSIGSLEALTLILKEKEIPIRKTSIGNITKKDLMEANSSSEPVFKTILGFNIANETDESIKIITNDVIYRIVEDFESWKEELEKKQEEEELSQVSRPFKVRIMEGYIFRQCNPAVIGVEVISGLMESGKLIMNIDGKELSRIRGIQHEQKNVEKAEAGKQVAISLDGVIVGRHIKEGDILYAGISEDEFKKLKEFKKHLTPEEKEILKEIAEIKRRNNPVWGI